MNHLRVVVILIVAAAPFQGFAKPRPCSLELPVLAAYERSGVSLEEIGATRRAISTFMGCDPATVDEISRRVFFAAVEREFSTNPEAQLAAWQQQYPDSEALWEGINIHQRELRDYLDRLFDPVRDSEFRTTVLRYGKGSTIARLGPDAKEDVKRSLGDASRYYGLSKTYNPQFDAVEALGYWIDPSNTHFSPVEKAEFEKILTDLLAFGETSQPAPPAKPLVRATLNSLAHSGDPASAAAIEKWLSKRRNPNDELSRLAKKTLAEINRKAKR